MKKKISIHIIILISLLFFTSCKNDTHSTESNSNLNSAHIFKLMDITDEKQVSLSDYTGKPVILNFWATWCTPCRQEMPFLQMMWEKYKDDGLIFIGINVMDDPKSAIGFLSDFNIEYLNLIDKPGNVSGKYGVVALPATFFIDKNGKIYKQNYGPFLGESGEKLFVKYTEEILK